MQISKINSTIFKQDSHPNKPAKKHEIIDYLVDNVRNPRDVEDCVAVPRGIFKAYIYLMAASSLMLIAAALPQKWKIPKIFFNVGSATLSAVSAVYFAKPFAIKGLSPTVKKDG